MKPSWTYSGALGFVSLGKSTGSGTTQMSWALPVSPEFSPPSVLWIGFPRLRPHCYQLGKAGLAWHWRRSWGDWLRNGVMQRLLEGCLESPALKGTVYPKATAPEERHSLQVDDVGSILEGDWEFAEPGFLVRTSWSCEKAVASKGSCAQRLAHPSPECWHRLIQSWGSDTVDPR